MILTHRFPTPGALPRRGPIGESCLARMALWRASETAPLFFWSADLFLVRLVFFWSRPKKRFIFNNIKGLYLIIKVFI